MRPRFEISSRVRKSRISSGVAVVFGGESGFSGLVDWNGSYVGRRGSASSDVLRGDGLREVLISI